MHRAAIDITAFRAEYDVEPLARLHRDLAPFLYAVGVSAAMLATVLALGVAAPAGFARMRRATPGIGVGAVRLTAHCGSFLSDPALWTVTAGAVVQPFMSHGPHAHAVAGVLLRSRGGLRAESLAHCRPLLDGKCGRPYCIMSMY